MVFYCTDEEIWMALIQLDLDESGGQVGVTPHSNGEEVYHYHVINEIYTRYYIVLFGVDLKGTPNSIQ